MQSAAFLDRDGVLNRLVMRDGRAVSPRRLDEFELLPGVAPAVKALRRAGLRVIVVTNQPDLARGTLDPVELQRMHRRLRRAVGLDAIYTCPHNDAAGCACRKPKAGLLQQASREWDLHLEASFLVGDSWKDVAAGKAAGCATVVIGPRHSQPAGVQADFAAWDLPEAAEIIVGQLAKRNDWLSAEYAQKESDPRRQRHSSADGDSHIRR